MPVLAPLAGLLIAVVIILILIAAWVFAELLARVFQNLPLVGGWVASNIRSVVNTVSTFIGRTWDSAIADLGWFFSAIAVWGWEFLYALVRTAGHAVNLGAKAEADAQTAIGLIGPSVSAGVKSAVGTAEGFATSAANGVLHEAQSLYNQAVATAAADAAGVLSQAEGLFNRAEAGLSGLGAELAADVNGLTARIASVEAALAGDVSSLVGQITSDLAIAIATAEQAAKAAETAAVGIAATLAQEAAGGAVGALDQAAHDLVLGPWAALLPVVQPIVAELGQAEAAVLGLPDILAGSAPATVPAIFAGVLPLVAAIASEVDRCVVPNCRAVNNLGSLFNGLEELGLAGVLLALVGAAVANPQAAATEVIDVTGWAVHLVGDLAADVVG